LSAVTRTDTSLVGALLDRRYRVDRLLARGGMSSVYRGVDTRLDRPVAIKIMDPRFADDRSFLERFEREARSAARLHHPHIVAVHDQGIDQLGVRDDDRRAFLVMELVDGGTLRDLLDARGPLDGQLALSIIEPVLSALATAHRAGLAHRDVKPENVLIGTGNTDSGVVKVADFGLVRAVASAGTTSSSVILGTVAYLSPEQVTTGAANEQGDVYSAGVLLYEMLTGRTPYTGDTALSVAYRHVNEDIPAPSLARPEIPPALDDLVLRATRRDPQARPADAGAFLAEVEQVRTSLGMGLVPVPVPPSPDVPPLSDSEKTMPAFPAVDVDVAGPRGTRALSRAVPPVTGGSSVTAVSAQPSGATLPTARPPEVSAPDDSPRRSRRWLALWIVLALVLTGGIGAGVWWFTGGRWVDVPAVAGQQQAAAEQQLREAELAPRVITERHNTTPAGSVIRTDPPGGAEALVGDEVTLVVSTGRPVVPDITPGTSLQQAEAAIRAVQLVPKHDPAADDYSETVPAGTVLSIRPAPGNKANIGDVVTIALSKGPPPTPVPNVVGQSRENAFAALRDAGFEPFDAGKEFSPDVPAGSVTRTDPAAGTTGTKRVGVYVSNAVEVPLVLGRTVDDAERILSDAGLRADFGGGGRDRGRGRGNDDDDKPKKPRFGIVVGQDPQPGQRVEPNSKVKLNTLP
jgi:beta-lactam-binding protein with PASTA domain/serine/threonine protein kinase